MAAVVGSIGYSRRRIRRVSTLMQAPKPATAPPGGYPACRGRASLAFLDEPIQECDCMCIEASFVRIFARLLESSECICTLEYGRHEHRILFGVQRHQQHGDRTHPRSVPLHYLFGQPDRESTNPLDHVVNGRNSRYPLAVVPRPELTQCVCSICAQPLQDIRELPMSAEVDQVSVWLYRDRDLLGQQLVAIACELLCGLAFVVQFLPLDVSGFEVTPYAHEVVIPFACLRHVHTLPPDADRVTPSAKLTNRLLFVRPNGKTRLALRHSAKPASCLGSSVTACYEHPVHQYRNPHAQGSFFRTNRSKCLTRFAALVSDRYRLFRALRRSEDQ